MMTMAKKQVERHVGFLIEAGMILASELDPDTLLQRIADLSREVIGARYAAVGVLGDHRQLLRFIHSGIDQATVDRIGHLPEGRGVLGAVIDEQRPLRLHDIADHPRSYGFPEHHPPMRSFLGVPIVVRGRVFGRLYITEKQGAPDFTKDDERIALTFAAQAGVALENARLYEEVQARGGELARRVRELSSVEHVGHLLISGVGIDDVLRSAAEEALKLTGASRSVLMLLDVDSGELVIKEIAGDAPPGDYVGTRLAPNSSKAHAVLARMTGESVEDLAADAEVDPEVLGQLGHPRSGAFVPLIVRGRGVGALAVYDRTDQRPFSSDDLAILQILANQAAIALENERLTMALRDLAVLEERERISKELHDGVIQSIYSVGLSLQGSRSLLQRNPELVTTRIDQAIAELDNVVRDVRSYIFELRPKSVEELGLGTAVAELVKEFEVNTLAHTTLQLDDEACSALGEDQQTHVVQIVREVLSNIARHAHATEVDISFRKEGSLIELIISDDGRGFDPDTVHRGHGLRNMEERARKLGGTLEISPGDGKGTRHTLWIPKGLPDD
jgi:signal transduction histidine kinase